MARMLEANNRMLEARLADALGDGSTGAFLFSRRYVVKFSLSCFSFNNFPFCCLGSTSRGSNKKGR
jgi:hypothetical protein